MLIENFYIDNIKKYTDKTQILGISNTSNILNLVSLLNYYHKYSIAIEDNSNKVLIANKIKDISKNCKNLCNNV